MSIEVDNLSFSYGKSNVIEKINFAARPGDIVAVLGPNGVGKTTFFRCLLGFLKPETGVIKINGTEISQYSEKELAHEIAYIPQTYNPAFNHSVLDCVLMGFASKIGIFDVPSETDKKDALKIMSSLGIEGITDSGCMKISGGERQLMLIARALVQDAKILIMDEPTANLDFGNAHKVMQTIKKLAEKGYTVIFSTHDPNQALTSADRIVAMKDGKIISDTDTNSFDPSLLKKLYNVEVSSCDVCGVVKIC